MHNYKNKKITIFGLGQSGVAVAKKLSGLGAKITVSEKRKREECDQSVVEELASAGIKFEFGGHSLYSVAGAHLIVVCPGVHLDLPVLNEAARSNIQIISEIELANRFLHKPIIAITGTNGKTTTTTLIYEFLAAAGKKAALAGNIGIPLITINDRNLDFIVCEVSSYQLEGVSTFRPWISVILNITPDHLERHKSIEEYCRAKSRIFMNQGKTDYIVYNAEDRYLGSMIESSIARKIPFSVSDIFFDPGEILLKGRHNLENIMAASYAARLAGVSKNTIVEVLERFKGVPHRIEFTRKHRGISFYNDSKGTNPDSTIKAIQTLAASSHKPNIILILGGVDKGLDLNELIAEVKANVKEVILIGQAARRFNRELSNAGYNNIRHAASMSDAVILSHQIAAEGDQVLLSPACSSFDMFANFEQRGDVFKQAVLALEP